MSCIENYFNITELFIEEAEIRSTSKKDDFFLMWTTCTTYSSQNNWKHQNYPWEELYFSVSSKQLKLDDKNLTMLPALKSDRLKKFYGSFSQGNFWLPNKIGKIYRLDLFCLQKHWQLMAQKSINKWAPQVRLSIRHGRVKKQKKLFFIKRLFPYFLLSLIKRWLPWIVTKGN